jgi:phospho-N-acetylmuramoyl-pentapeptide-transferase
VNALLVGAGISLVFTLVLTPAFIRLFSRIGWGQFIRDDGPQSHHSKRGTPTMGGIVFITGAVFGYVVAHLVLGQEFTLGGWLVVLMMVGLGFVGFLDDFLKVRNQRSLGLGGWQKIAGQVVVGTLFALLAINFPNKQGLTPAGFDGRDLDDNPVQGMAAYVSGLRDIDWLNFFFAGSVVGILLFVLWTNVIVVSASNGVNVTDGLDGLATGASILALTAYVFIGFWQYNQSCFQDDTNPLTCYTVRDPLDLAVIAGCVVGSLIGFLWWNTSPAQIFMGDSGSLGLGGAIAALAILTRTDLLLILIGGLFLIVTGSVIVQRVYFKLTHGKRIFLMSPIHHHFELKGWAEITIVVRFWLIAGLFVAAGIGLFYLEWSQSN